MIPVSFQESLSFASKMIEFNGLSFDANFTHAIVYEMTTQHLAYSFQLNEQYAKEPIFFKLLQLEKQSTFLSGAGVTIDKAGLISPHFKMITKDKADKMKIQAMNAALPQISKLIKNQEFAFAYWGIESPMG